MFSATHLELLIFIYIIIESISQKESFQTSLSYFFSLTSHIQLDTNPMNFI